MTEMRFRYPTQKGMLTSVEDYGRLFLPKMHDPSAIAARMQQGIALVSQYAAETGDWLDYGCGGGVFAWHLSRTLPRWCVHGIDGDESSLAIARRFFSSDSIDYQFKPYTALTTLDKGRFNGISLLEVIEHVDNPGEVLSALNGALKPNGLLLVSTPDYLGLLSLHDEIRRRVNRAIGRRNDTAYLELLKSRSYDPTTNSGHVVLYSLQTLTTLLRTKGFEPLAFALAPRDRRLLSRIFPDTLIVLSRKIGEMLAP